MPKPRLKLIPTSCTEDMLDTLDTHMPIISLESVKLKLMLIQLTSTTDMPDTLDTDSDMDMLDIHMLVSMEVTHMPLMLMPLMLMLHLTQPTPISSTPPV